MISMRRALLIAAVLVATCLAGRPASAAFVTGCCACVANEKSMQSGPPRPETEALFCGLVQGEGYPEFVQRCQSAGGNDAPCIDPNPGQTCNQALLAEFSIVCPVAPGAPTANAWGLGGLFLALTGLGVAAMRRRAR